ncbi:hypothetical protein EV668_0804 [Enterovirga rhinocerotis]|uniref:Uncharacterized protein n=1 Tax=Enterovirga rhinocerotis TaxID=1339210 RepID=A0A4V3DYQ0_9HYPH|nr:hypothetical protein EV668_0804 [Enterovirga rhinocerotis]
MQDDTHPSTPVEESRSAAAHDAPAGGQGRPDQEAVEAALDRLVEAILPDMRCAPIAAKKRAPVRRPPGHRDGG